MSGTTKRLDLQFGAFACSVQGFDDPVVLVQQVLHALQSLLEETPDLADASISFDTDAIERLIREVARRADVDEAGAEIVPGLIIVHRGEEDAIGAAPGRTAESQWPPAAAGASFAPEEPAKPEQDAAAEETPHFVNIFAAAAGTEPEAAPSQHDFGSEVADSGDSFGARLSRIAAEDAEEAETVPPATPFGSPEEPPVRNIFAESGEAPGGGVFADPLADDVGVEEGDHAAASFFASLRSEEPAAAKPAAPEFGDDAGSGNIFGVAMPEAPVEDEASPAQVVEHLFAELKGTSEEPPDTEECTAASLATAAGAESVTDLMVAAAWMVLLHGQTSFSRRDVIKVFETIPGDHPKTLEARIKGFGKAVRNGQLVAIAECVFGLSRAELDRFESLL